MTVLAWADAPAILALTKEERLFLWTGVLVGVLLFGAVIVARVDRWRKRQMVDDDEDGVRMVGSYRDMYDRGEITKAEYDRVLRRAAERVGAKPKPAEPPIPAETPEPPPAPPA